MAAKKDEGRRLVAENRKARHEYFVTDSVEAGLQLMGTEVKSLRKGQANIAESYASFEEGGMWLINAYIPSTRAPAASSNTTPGARGGCCCTRRRSTSW